jgi:membrane protein DedA with SNARE-associated domain
VSWLVTTIGTLGYPGIFILMALESSVVPVPSELVMPPAGYLAQQGRMNVWAAIFWGTAGSLAGAYANYYAARRLGRPLLVRYGRFVGIGAHKLERVETFFRDHGEISTFLGRLFPVVRHLISLPAGLAGMNHARFSLYTLAGAAIWVSVLTAIGYVIGANEELVLRSSHRALLALAVASVCIVAGYLWRHRRRKAARRPPDPGSRGG